MIMDLLSKPVELGKIREKFKKKTEDFVFDPIIPKDQRQPLTDGYE
jgi:hypothetical protein